MKIRNITLLLICILSIPCAFAQEKTQNVKERKIYLELRPLQFVMNGYSVVGHYAISERSQLGANIFAATLSDGVTDFVWDSKGALDLEAKQDVVLSISYRYFLNKDKPQRNWFIGLAAGVEFYTLTNQNDAEEQDYEFYYITPRIGYLWHPFQRKLPRFFVAAEAVVVLPIITDGKIQFRSGGTTEISSIIPSPLVGIGFKF